MASDCAICMEMLNDKDARQLPCHPSHVFCYQCLFKYAESNSIRYGDNFPCPICKTEVVWPKNGVESFKKIFFRRTISENDLQVKLMNEKKRTLFEKQKNLDTLNEETNELMKMILRKQNEVEKNLNEFYKEKLNSLIEIDKKLIDLNKKDITRGLNQLEVLSREDIERDLKESLKNLSKDKVTVERKSSEIELCTITQTKDEDPTFQYGLVQQGPHNIIGGNYCFFLQTISGFYEFSNSNALLYDSVNYSSANISNDSSLYVFKNDDNDIMNSNIFKWDKETKKFHSCLKIPSNISEINLNDFVYFRHKNDLIFYDVKTFKIYRQSIYDQFKNSCHTKFINGYWFILKNNYDFRYYSMNNLYKTRNYQGHNILIFIINDKILLRKNIINELRNGKILFCNEKYVFLLDFNNKSAKAYPHKNLFQEGQLIAHFQSDTEIHFCILSNVTHGTQYLMKCYKF